MKIDGKKTGIGPDTLIGRTNEGPNAAKKADSAGEKAPASDAVDISSKARDLNRLKRMLDSVPEIRRDLVVRLKTDIANGDYQVDAGKVAEKMIERALRDVLVSKI